MADTQILGRITADPAIFGGKPIVRGMRVSVELILSLLAHGESREAILDNYPELEPEDIRACIAYANAVIAHDSLGRGPDHVGVKFPADRCAGRRLADARHCKYCGASL